MHRRTNIASVICVEFDKICMDVGKIQSGLHPIDVTKRTTDEQSLTSIEPMIPFFLHIPNGVRSVATKCTVYALGNGSLDQFHWLRNMLLRNGCEISREECVLSMEREMGMGNATVGRESMGSREKKNETPIICRPRKMIAP